MGSIMATMKPDHTSKNASPEDWHPADIVAAVRKKGSTVRKLSIAAGMHPGSLRVALSEPRFKAQQRIADFIGVPPQAIWPSRYEADGSPKRGLRGQRHQPFKCNAADGGVNGNRQEEA